MRHVLSNVDSDVSLDQMGYGTTVAGVPNACNFVKWSIANTFGVTVGELNARTRLTADVSTARQFAMYVAHVKLGMSLCAVGRAFGRDRTTVSYACRIVEDRRDDARVDFMLQCMERSVEEWAKLAICNCIDGRGVVAS